MKKILFVMLILIMAGTGLFAGGSGEKKSADSGKLESELVVYSTIFAEYAEAMKSGFEKKYPGVTLNVINPGGTEAMMKKLEAESANPQADVIHSGSSLSYEFAIKKDLITPYKPQAERFDSEIKIGKSKLTLSHPENYYHVWSLMFSGIMYNSAVVKDLNLPLPESYKDLTKPVYKGQVISANPLKSSTAVTNVMATIDVYKDEVWKLWDGINENIPYYSNSSSKIYTLTNKGEFAFAICLSRPVFVAKKEGYPVDFIFPKDGSMVADNSMAIVKGAKHPELAKKFVDFILGDEMQALGAEYLYIPVKKGVVEASQPFSLESVASKAKRVIIPDAKTADAYETQMQEAFGKYTRDKTK